MQLIALTGIGVERTISLLGDREVFDAGCLLIGRLLKRKPFSIGHGRLLFSYAALAMLVFSASNVVGESCQTSSDMEEATRTALTSAAIRYFGMIAKGDTASLRQGAIPSVAGDFSGAEALIKDNQAALGGAKAAARPPFLLVAEGTAPLARANFSAGFSAPTARPAIVPFSR